MREVKIGDKTISIKATPIALLYYKQEFGTDMIADLIQLSQINESNVSINGLTLLQLVWAMNKAAEGVGKPFPSFANWLLSFENFDVTDADAIQSIINEAVDGFFRTANASKDGGEGG